MTLLLIGLFVLLLVSITLAIALGPVEIPFGTVWRIAIEQISGIDMGEWSKAQFQIVWYLRFPRVLLGVLVGATLSVVGVAMQAMVRNPLADPYLLGVSSGAATGAVLVLFFGVLSSLGVFALSAGAFTGAMLSLSLVFLLAQHRRNLSPTRMILAGVAMSYFFSAVTSLLTLVADDYQAARRALEWMLGGLAGTQWVELTLPALALVLGTAYLVLQARSLNALLVGEETARALGVDTTRFRRELFVVMALLTGIMVAVSGAIGFVGLMMPHIVRLVVGSDHRRVLPVAAFAGAIFLVWVDVAARTVIAPQELPVGVITALFGAPFFLWLMRHKADRLRGER